MLHPRPRRITVRQRASRDDVLEHAKLIQAINARLAGHALPLRGAAVTITTAAAAVSLSGNAAVAGQAAVIVWPAIAVILAIGALDGYYLWQSRLFRALYNAVIGGGVPWLRMDVRPYRATTRYYRAALSRTVLAVYLPLAVVLAVAGLASL